MLLFDFLKIGNKLFSIRKELGLTQEEVAERAEISARTYADMERGSVNIRTETLLHICKVLSITPNDILVETNDNAQPTIERILDLLSHCSQKEKETALRLLSVYLESIK